MLIRWLRSLRNSAASSWFRFRPSISIVPLLGSMSRLSKRTSVDLPEPDKPMITNSSPSWTSKETSWTARVAPVRRWISGRPMPSPARASACPTLAPSPKTLVRLAHSIMRATSAEPLLDELLVAVDVLLGHLVHRLVVLRDRLRHRLDVRQRQLEVLQHRVELRRLL